MLDAFGREINYMRVSITDRCNLRCGYCMPKDGVPAVSHSQVLRYEELLRLCAIAARAGIRSVRVTGGEPLVRKGCVGFLRGLGATPGIERLSLTTNGVLLEQFADELAKRKLDSVNISLDSLDPQTYARITRRDSFPAVWRGLGKAVTSGLRVKINCLPMAGLNDAELLDFARLTENMPVNVRFIEFMPTRSGSGYKGISSEEILNRLAQVYPDLSPDTHIRGSGPARYFISRKMRGSVGIISTGSTGDSCICTECNRVRLTSEGFLKLCLFHGDGLDLRGLLREGADDEQILAAFTQAIARKPGGQSNPGRGIENMSKIGG